MADKRCPMCGRPNPETNETCGFCGARLKPLVISSAPPPSASPSPPPPPRPTVPAAAPPPEEPESLPEPDQAEEDIADWLLRIRSLNSESADPEGDAYLEDLGSDTEAEPDLRTVTDWLNRARLPDDRQVPPEEPTESPTDWLGRLRSEAQPMDLEPEEEPDEDEPPAEDWLARLRSRHGPAEPRFPPPKVEPPPPPSPPAPGPDAATVRRRPVSELFRSQFTAPPPELPPTEAPSVSQGESVPDWLATVRSAQAAEKGTQPEAPGPPVDSDQALEPAPAEPESPPDRSGPSDEAKPAPAKAEALPEWLQPAGDDTGWLTAVGFPTGAAEMAPVSADEPPSQAPAPLTSHPETAAPVAEEDRAEGSVEAPPGLAPAELPDWLAATRPGDLELPQFAEAPPAEESLDLPELAPAQIPEPTRLPDVQPPESPSEDLAPATLPAWLEAMRPIETSGQPIGLEDDYEEAAGPLAGMRGLLAAEPIIAKPRPKASAAVTSRLEVSDIQAAQAELLRGLLIEESRTKPALRRHKRGVPWDRWLVLLVMLSAVILPTVMGRPLLPWKEIGVPPEAESAFRVIDGLSSDAPVLLAFEYGPAALGELDAGAEALLSHLMARGTRLAVVSSQAAGAAAGHAALERAAGAHGYAYGRDYIHLGYLPGGPLGLLRFVIGPEAAIRRDYTGRLEPWESEALADVDSLADFKAIVVLAARPGEVQDWIEQVHVRTPGTPMIAAISAAAEPMLRPYFETDPPQLAGLVTGLNGAAGYERRRAASASPEAAEGAQDASLARARWDSFGFGLLAAAGLIVVGNLIYGAIGLVKRRRGG